MTSLCQNEKKKSSILCTKLNKTNARIPLANLPEANLALTVSSTVQLTMNPDSREAASFANNIHSFVLLSLHFPEVEVLSVHLRLNIAGTLLYTAAVSTPTSPWFSPCANRKGRSPASPQIVPCTPCIQRYVASHFGLDTWLSLLRCHNFSVHNSDRSGWGMVPTVFGFSHGAPLCLVWFHIINFSRGVTPFYYCNILASSRCERA